MKRWRGPISTVLFIEEDQLRDVAVFILQQKRYNVIYSLYIRHTSSSNIPYVARKGKRVYYVNGIYPTNTLRNIGIENILTSHYLLLNIDTIPSINTYDSILENARLLENHKNVLLLPVFYSSRRVSQMVKVMKNYEELYSILCFWRVEWRWSHQRRQNCLRKENCDCILPTRVMWLCFEGIRHSTFKNWMIGWERKERTPTKHKWRNWLNRMEWIWN